MLQALHRNRLVKDMVPDLQRQHANIRSGEWHHVQLAPRSNHSDLSCSFLNTRNSIDVCTQVDAGAPKTTLAKCLHNDDHDHDDDGNDFNVILFFPNAIIVQVEMS